MKARNGFVIRGKQDKSKPIPVGRPSTRTEEEKAANPPGKTRPGPGRG